MERKVIDIIEDIRTICRMESSQKPWLTKAEFLHVLSLMGLTIPCKGNMKVEAMNLLESHGWEQSTTLLTKKNAEIILGLLQKNMSDNMRIFSEKKPAEEVQEEIPWTQETPFINKETLEQSFPTKPIKDRVKEEKEKTEQLLKTSLVDQYLKSAVRNLDLIEEIHFVRGREITIIAKR